MIVAGEKGWSLVCFDVLNVKEFLRSYKVRRSGNVCDEEDGPHKKGRNIRIVCLWMSRKF